MLLGFSVLTVTCCW